MVQDNEVCWWRYVFTPGNIEPIKGTIEYFKSEKKIRKFLEDRFENANKKNLKIWKVAIWMVTLQYGYWCVWEKYSGKIIKIGSQKFEHSFDMAMKECIRLNREKYNGGVENA